ncbi:unnamed protein product [Adineta steineri]|uniref:Uncharacterized protein n=2 Tax=Adineta steineri TaxID=433720 RepID=A0A819HYW1_9BILA|nr:unnamed protein product [Adineta steineri]CAF3676035.1 unnamed protein product [Adineta steineri]CAF3903721.1 unnamed protein product [Adineta steineri]
MIVYILYKKHSKSVTRISNVPQYDHAIIIGAGIGGMVTAAYLSKHFQRITIIESDNVLNDALLKSKSVEILDYRCRLESPTSLGRSGVSQMYQLHVMEGEGYKILLELFPRLKDRLLNEYNVRSYSLKNESKLSINGVPVDHNFTEDVVWLGIDRFTLDIVLRQELCSQYGNQIEWKCNTRVKQLIVDRSLNIVRGIKYRSKQNDTLQLLDMYGDFIVDCTGRNSSSTKWLKQSLNLNVPAEEMHFGCGYLTFIGERFKTGDPSLDLKPVVCTAINAPVKNIGCYITPIRQIKTIDKNSLGTLATIAIHCVNSEYPPNDSYENLLEWTKENLDPEYYSILKATKVYSPLIPYRRVMNHRKYVELLGTKWPQNYVLLGDAMCTFNPQYGQGMTHVSRQARELRAIFDESHHTLQEISHIFNRRASVITEECWLWSITSDWKTPTLKIIKTDENGNTKTYERTSNSATTKNLRPLLPLKIRFFQWYIYWFSQYASKSSQFSTYLLLVVNQHSSPLTLFKPATFLTICRFAIMNYLTLSRQRAV